MRLPWLGSEANLAAWRGYVESYPGYATQPLRIGRGGVVAVLGQGTACI